MTPPLTTMRPPAMPPRRRARAPWVLLSVGTVVAVMSLAASWVAVGLRIGQGSMQYVGLRPDQLGVPGLLFDIGISALIILVALTVTMRGRLRTCAGWAAVVLAVFLTLDLFAVSSSATEIEANLSRRGGLLADELAELSRNALELQGYAIDVYADVGWLIGCLAVQLLGLAAAQAHWRGHAATVLSLAAASIAVIAIIRPYVVVVDARNRDHVSHDEYHLWSLGGRGKFLLAVLIPLAVLAVALALTRGVGRLLAALGVALAGIVTLGVMFTTERSMPHSQFVIARLAGPDAERGADGRIDRTLYLDPLLAVRDTRAAAVAALAAVVALIALVPALRATRGVVRPTAGPLHHDVRHAMPEWRQGGAASAGWPHHQGYS